MGAVTARKKHQLPLGLTHDVLAGPRAELSAELC